MSERIQGLTVVFERDLHEEEAQALADVIGRIRGVTGVSLRTSEPQAWIAREQVRTELRMELMDLLRPIYDLLLGRTKPTS